MQKNSRERSILSGALPAVVIGGPPHSGKSVLVYSLTRALRAAGVSHYVLRACPDGEGDWANEADQQLVQTIRYKSDYSRTFIERIVHALQQRRVPMLVDVGGRPRSWQEAVFDHCTHAVLLIAVRPEDPAAYEQNLTQWKEMMERHDVPIIARLQSVLSGEDALHSEMPQISGVLSGLERGQTAAGPAFDALVARLIRLLSKATKESEENRERRHMDEAPAEIALHLPRLARTLGASDGRWQLEQLPTLCREYLPAGKPLALYGRAPNWIYAALALLAYPADVWVFDPRLGWLAPPPLPLKDTPGPTQAGWQVAIRAAASAGVIIVEMEKEGQYLDVEKPKQLPLPAVPPGEGLILSGPVPHWLLLAAARQYGPRSRWLAVYYPQEQGAVVVHSKDDSVRLGQLVQL